MNHFRYLFDNTPESLIAHNQWILWDYQERDGKPVKVPLQSNLRYAKSNDPTTWTTYSNVVDIAEKRNIGIGFVFSENDEFIGIDLDDCRSPETKVVDKWALDIINEAKTYAEVSPSKTGVKVYGRGKLPAETGTHKPYKSGEVGLFEKGRYFAVTGWHLESSPRKVRNIQSLIDWLYPAVYNPSPESNLEKRRIHPPLDDKTLIEKMCISNPKAKALWHGDVSGYPSQSEADSALCFHLAFWTNHDPVKMDSLFRQSGLYRADKWGDREDYRLKTLFKAIEGVKDGYIAAKPQLVETLAKPQAETHFVTDPKPVIDESLIERTAQIRTEPKYNQSAFVPQNTWLSRYLQYVEPITDAPQQFGVFSGLFVLSMVLRDSYIPFGHKQIRPNIWLALIAPSSLYRKSTCLGIAQQFLDRYQPGMMLPEQVTPEAFITHLHENNSFGYFVWNEISSQLEAFENRSYLRGYKQMLTDIYDLKPYIERQTMKDGSMRVENPFVSIFTASTQDWLNQCLSEGNLKGGFLPRFIWVQATSKNRHIGWPNSPDPIVFENLTSELDSIESMFRGGIVPTDTVKRRFEEMSAQLANESMKNREFEGLLGAFYSRLETYTLKFAIIYQAMLQHAYEPDNTERILNIDALEYAISVTLYLKEGVSTLLENMAYNDDMRDRLKVLNAIREEPGINTSRLYQLSRLSKRNMSEVLETLQESDLIAPQKNATGNRGRPTIQYFPVKTDV